VFSGAGESIAAKILPGPSLKPKKFGVLRLNAKKKFPRSVLPAQDHSQAGENQGDDHEAESDG
jgi:hypothetical protein